VCAETVYAWVYSPAQTRRTRQEASPRCGPLHPSRAPPSTELTTAPSWATEEGDSIVGATKDHACVNVQPWGGDRRAVSLQLLDE